jgi:anti-sigma factor RsiW
MDCQELREHILESFEEPPSAAMQANVDAHLSTCEACARFARVQKMLDAGLSTMLTPPAISPAFRLVLRQRIRWEAAPSRLDTLPDIVHFASFGLATLVCTAILPFSPSAIIGVGTTVALSSYVLLSAVRSSFEDSPLEADV